MFSHQSLKTSRRWTAAARVVAVTLIGVIQLSACGSVGPSQRTEQVSDRKFVGVECEPGLVLECEPACSRGDAKACEIAGLGYLSGHTVSKDVDRARIMLERACNKSKALACSGWAKMAEDGQGVELSPERQGALLTLGCNDGDANACYRLGRRLMGTGDRPASSANLTQAHELFDRACTGGDAHGCLQLGIAAKSGQGAARDVVKAASWLTHACDRDLATGCYELGDLQVSAGVAVHNPARGRQHLDKACILGSGAACAQLAQLMETGEKNVARAQTLHARACELEQWASCLAVGRYEVESSPSSAERAFDRACSAGLTTACFEQAKLLDGRVASVEPAPEQALALYEKACAADVPLACGYAAQLALSQLNGKPPTRESRHRLVEWVRKGCETERQDESCLVLARWRSTGENGVARDAKQAALLLGPLCAQAGEPANAKPASPLYSGGYAEACHHLARLHETGLGMTRNALGAATLYDKGCAAGYQPACLSSATLRWRGVPGAKRDPESAVSEFKRLCAEAEEKAVGVGPEACVHLGYAQATGVGTARNLEQAKTHFEKFCTLGSQLACAHLGHYLVSNRASEPDHKRGEGLLRSACDSANGQGCFFLADLPQVTKTQRTELLKRACQLDIAEACASERVPSQ